jgi:hypothetical protein
LYVVLQQRRPSQKPQTWNDNRQEWENPVFRPSHWEFSSISFVDKVVLKGLIRVKFLNTVSILPKDSLALLSLFSFRIATFLLSQIAKYGLVNHTEIQSPYRLLLQSPYMVCPTRLKFRRWLFHSHISRAAWFRSRRKNQKEIPEKSLPASNSQPIVFP